MIDLALAFVGGVLVGGTLMFVWWYRALRRFNAQIVNIIAGETDLDTLRRIAARVCGDS